MLFLIEEQSLEEQAFDIITKYYSEAMRNEDEWDLGNYKIVSEINKGCFSFLSNYRFKYWIVFERVLSCLDTI